MAKIISILSISYFGWKLTGYDFFALSTLITYAIEIYNALTNLLKKYEDIINLLKTKLPDGR